MQYFKGKFTVSLLLILLCYLITLTKIDFDVFYLIHAIRRKSYHILHNHIQHYKKALVH